jgi:hypothetical protein
MICVCPEIPPPVFGLLTGAGVPQDVKIHRYEIHHRWRKPDPQNRPFFYISLLMVDPV